MQNARRQQDRPLTVTELNSQIKSVLARTHGDVWVEGEVSRFTAHRSGHWYFSLVDGRDTLNAVMFRGNNSRMSWRPREGDRVVCWGGIDVYGPHGKYNLLLRRMEPFGAGARAIALEQLKRRLADEGLFAADRKRELPFLPKAVGVATSPTGAAFQDILQVMGRRFPGMPIYLAPCRVQGEGAALEIAAALRLLQQHGRADVIIVGRGGGSIEDLWAFNEEPVVRAIADCAVPVISAVGHEIDTSLADLAADKVAPTPSAAAELAVPEQAGLLQLVDELEDRLVDGARRHVDRRREHLARLRLLHPGQRLRLVRQRVAELEERLGRGAGQALDRGRHRLGTASARLDALSPLRVLERGYSITTDAEGRAVVDASALSPGDPVDLRFARGRATATVVATSST
ncbi:MAG: exodeoxyribonuclease VII large subunit [Alphaproteobacteria bacterium]|nr:exodeoxyribonuclease VII large subunit [Alphaproteobacteria bacterium]